MNLASDYILLGAANLLTFLWFLMLSRLIGHKILGRDLMAVLCGCCIYNLIDILYL